MSNVTYSFVKTEDGTLTLRSTVSSFGLDSVTDKDVNSFYKNFSDKAYLDTGLLPVDGTGLLAYRKAGNHAQITYQIKPGIYYINWGSYEGDHNAVAYYVAQPYRIIVADLLNDNLLGARTFYSPYPITHPDAQLYHVNLPNINCKGYRGNGVGWICLYHTHDITSYSFNEKVAHILERCSGIEAYNDQNMSETDGPRFYQSHYSENSDFDFLWDPKSWQHKTEQEGYEWTLDPDLWIPITVKGIDDQGEHYPNGEPLTIYTALFGNYAAYYNDTYLPKPINALAREDLELSNDFVLSNLAVSYNSSSLQGSSVSLNTFLNSLMKRAEDSIKKSPSLTSDEDENLCSSCGTEVGDDFYSAGDDNMYCDNCFNEEFVYVEHLDKYYPSSNEDVFYDESSSQYFHIPSLNSFEYYCCENCSTHHYVDPYSNTLIAPKYSSLNSSGSVCTDCLDYTENFYCSSCNSKIPNPDFYSVPSSYGKHYCNSCFIHLPVASKISAPTSLCICGSVNHLDELSNFHQANLDLPLKYLLRYSFDVEQLFTFDLPYTKEHFTTIIEASGSVTNDIPKPAHVVSYSFKIAGLCSSCIDKILNLYENYLHDKLGHLDFDEYFKAYMHQFTFSQEFIIDTVASHLSTLGNDTEKISSYLFNNNAFAVSANYYY